MIHFGGNIQVVKFMEWLYEDATIYLDRKKENFDKYKKILMKI
jgi:hypothetical protein